MDYSPIASTWACLDRAARVIIVTEPDRAAIAGRIRADLSFLAADVAVFDLTADADWRRALGELGPEDLLIALLSLQGFMNSGYRDLFPPFSKPAGCAAKYIFLRLDIPEAALLSGLNTPLSTVEEIVARCRAYTPGTYVRVRARGGTDIEMELLGQQVLPYLAQAPGGNAFLPPGEVSNDVAPGSANGVILADVTAGEVRFGGELIDPMGIVDRPVSLTVERGLVTRIEGGAMARRLDGALSRLDKGLKVLVELGHGLSSARPTGIIGVDESIAGTCHFGIGDRNPYHVDLVVAEPRVEILNR